MYYQDIHIILSLIGYSYEDNPCIRLNYINYTSHHRLRRPSVAPHLYFNETQSFVGWKDSRLFGWILDARSCASVGGRERSAKVEPRMVKTENSSSLSCSPARFNFVEDVIQRCMVISWLARWF